MAKEWHVLSQIAPIGGLDVSKPENQLTHLYIPEGLNVVVEDGAIVTRGGYDQLLEGIEYYSTGRVMEGFEYGDASGNLHFVIVTTDRFIEYVKDVYDFFTDTEGPGWQDRTKMVNAASVSFTADSGDAVFMSPVGGVSLDNLYITNGVDKIQVWNGSSNLKYLGINPFSTFTAKCLIGFKSHLIVGNVVEDGKPFPYRMRFSQVGNPAQWDDITVNSAGFRNLIEDSTNSKIQSFHPIKEALVVYKEKSIYIVTYEGPPNYFVPFQRVPDRGAISPKAVAPVLDGNTHLVVSEDNIFLFDGFNFQVPPIGDRIKKDFYSDLNWSQRHKIFAKAFPQRFEAWIMYPAGVSTEPNKAYCWNWLTNSWTLHQFHDTHNCFMNVTGFFDERTPLLGINENLMKLFNTNSDNGNNINWFFRTKLSNWQENKLGDQPKTTQRVEIEYSGTAPQYQIGVSNNILDAPVFETASTITDTPLGVPKGDSRTTGIYLCLKIKGDSQEPATKIASYRIYTSARGRK